MGWWVFPTWRLALVALAVGSSGYTVDECTQEALYTLPVDVCERTHARTHARALVCRLAVYQRLHPALRTDVRLLLQQQHTAIRRLR